MWIHLILERKFRDNPQIFETFLTEIFIFLVIVVVEMQQQQLLVILFYRLDDSEMDIVHIFPTQGSLVWKFESMQKLMEVLPQLKAANIDGKSWFLRILPEIKVDEWKKLVWRRMNVNDGVLVSLLLTLNIFRTLLECFYC